MHKEKGLSLELCKKMAKARKDRKDNMQYEYGCWYEGTFSPKNTSTLKEGMEIHIGKTVKVQAWEDILEGGEFKGQQRLSLLEMLGECCWIPEEDFAGGVKIESPVKKFFN